MPKENVKGKNSSIAKAMEGKENTKVKKVSKTAVKVAEKTETKATKRNHLSAPVFSLKGVEEGVVNLPKETFGIKINKSLLAQAMRVYLNNLKGHHSNTKTRGEVTASTKKLFKQKGTGRARHGTISAPIFVGGGIALGPKSRKTILDLPKKMKKAALISALAQKALELEVATISDLEKATGKTKQMVQFLDKTAKKSVLIVSDKALENVQRAIGNIKTINFMQVDQLNAYEVIKHKSLIFTQEALEKLPKAELKKDKKEGAEASK